MNGTAKIADPKALEKKTADANRWRDRLAPDGAEAVIWGRGGTVVRTPVGLVNVFLAEEHYLLARHMPPLNVGKFR